MAGKAVENLCGPTGKGCARADQGRGDAAEDFGGSY